ncbi:MAG TPA: hypothetical protein VGQ20_05350 [Acidimicrobiales bacterium]|jgi:hypothetical protein|nr:hypothetical protein [Acidimicrobiales bacterium]
MNKVIVSGIAALSIAGGSLALAAAGPLSAAFAQDGGTTTTVPSETPAPTTPTDPGTPRQHSGDSANCPNMGSDSTTPSTETTPSATAASFRRARL